MVTTIKKKAASPQKKPVVPVKSIATKARAAKVQVGSVTTAIQDTTQNATSPARKPVVKTASQVPVVSKVQTKVGKVNQTKAETKVVVAKKIATEKKAVPVKKAAAVTKSVNVEAVAKEKHKKPKLVRDSFTMPEAEYAVLGEVKRACIAAGIEVKKSQLLRVGLQLLKETPVSTLGTMIAELQPLKAGRPKLN
ncbi:hypothetical protein [Undibacterium sp. Ji22W]|uniref:hypothetical protein n=1 Tax=Undibacterium sp. Ji22W TaxID=3413038 RepID=UPI003BF0F1D5